LFNRYPVDRLLIAQAIANQLIIISINFVFDRYPIQRLW
jgi:PIN domain nuclease of toxin-antitoxin system